jgi:U2 small nuclear ribonucleoprotein A'
LAHINHVEQIVQNFTSFRRIAEGLELSLPNLETLVLTGNLIQELADLDPLASVKSLRTLSLLHNPVTTRQHYRLYIAFKLPQLRLLDFRKIKVKVSGLCLQQQMCNEQR